MKTFSRLFLICILALTSSLAHAQDISNMDKWSRQDWQRYNDRLKRDVDKAARAASSMDDYAPYSNTFHLLIRGGASNGMASSGMGGYNASASLMIGTIYGLCFCPEVGIDSRNIEDDGYNSTFAKGRNINLNSMNLKVRPLQFDFLMTRGPMSAGFCGGIYGSFDLNKTLEDTPIFNYINPGNNQPAKEYKPFDMGIHVGVDFFFWRLNMNLGFDKGLVPVFNDSGKCWNAFTARIGILL